MKIHEKYLEALKTFEDYVTVSEWAEKVGVMYPDLLEKANNEAKKQRQKLQVLENYQLELELEYLQEVIMV
jgi:hypothetical protein